MPTPTPDTGSPQDSDNAESAPPVPALNPDMVAKLKAAWDQAGETIAAEAKAEEAARAAGTLAAHEVPVDQRGHLYHTKIATRRSMLDLYLAESDKDVITAAKNREGDGDDPYLTVAATAGMSRECDWCGVEAEMTYDGSAVVSTTACELADGYPTTFTLTVTSGKVIVADSLHDVYSPDETGFASYNTTLGQSQTMKAMAEVGCAYGPVGNTCPSLYRTGENTYVIASVGFDDNHEAKPFDGEHLAHIVTDVWAYSIADLDDYLAKGGYVERGEVIELPNGVYTFTHHTGEKSFDHNAWHEPSIFATITRADA